MQRLQPLLLATVLVSLVVELALASWSPAAEPAKVLPARANEASQRLSARSTPVRVATLLPWAGDAVQVAGPPAVLVAGVRRALHRPLPDGLLDLGHPHSPSLERLAEARPDLVIADASIHARFVAPIEKLGARVLLLDSASVEGTLASLSRIAGALGGSTALDARVEAVRRRLAELAGQSDASLVALFGAPGSFYVMTERAWLGDLARRLGFELAVKAEGDERFPGLVAISDEAMAMARPDLVLLVAHGDSARIRAELERRTASGGAWAGLARARLGIHVLDPGLFSANPGLELVRAAETLVELGEPARAATLGALR
ncbi:MAG: ABC transporter substrate-binding protein [Myxococcota bacterium]